MLKLYLVRHGLTEWNKMNRFQGSSNISLCSEGIEQAMKISERLMEYKFEAIYSSDLSRAFETATNIARPHNIEVTKIPEFREIHFGEWEGLTQEEIFKLKNFDFAKWKASPHIAEIPGEGNLEAVRKRVEIGINKVLGTHIKGNIVIVSHGGTLKLLIMSMLGIDLSLYNKFWLGNTALSIIEIRKDRIMLNLLNDMNHLSYKG